MGQMLQTMLSRALFASLIAAATLAACATTGGDGPATASSERFAQIVPGRSTKTEVRALLGAPARSLWLRREQREAWGYPYRGNRGRRVFWIEWSSDGTVFSVSHEIDTWDAVGKGAVPPAEARAHFPTTALR